MIPTAVTSNSFSFITWINLPVITGFVDGESDWFNSSFRAYEEGEFTNYNFEIKPLYYDRAKISTRYKRVPV